MNSSVTSQPQPLYQISPPPRIGALSVEVLSYILLGLGGILPVVLLLGVALFVRCYRRHKEAQLDRWKAHLRQDRSVTGAAKSSQATRTKAQSDLENLSFSLHDSDLGLEPYFGAINRAADLNDTVDYPEDLKRSVTNSNVYFKDDVKDSSAEVDSAIADSEPGSSLTDHRSSASSSAEYRLQEPAGQATSTDSGRGSREVRPHEDVAGRRVPGHPGVIMGVNRLMDSTGRANDRSNRNNLSSTIPATNGTQPVKGRAPSPPLSRLEHIHPTFNSSKPKASGGVQKSGEERYLGNDEEQVLKYFDDIHSNLSFEMENSLSQDKKAMTSSFRRNSTFHTTRL